MSKKAVQQPDPRREFTAIVPRVTVEMLADWDLDEGIGVFSRFSSILRDLGELASIAANPEANLTVCLYKGQKVVAYCVRRPAPDIDRWGEMEPPILHEVFGETSRSWRDLKLMGAAARHRSQRRVQPRACPIHRGLFLDLGLRRLQKNPGPIPRHYHSPAGSAGL